MCLPASGIATWSICENPRLFEWTATRSFGAGLRAREASQANAIHVARPALERDDRLGARAVCQHSHVVLLLDLPGWLGRCPAAGGDQVRGAAPTVPLKAFTVDQPPVPVAPCRSTARCPAHPAVRRPARPAIAVRHVVRADQGDLPPGQRRQGRRPPQRRRPVPARQVAQVGDAAEPPVDVDEPEQVGERRVGPAVGPRLAVDHHRHRARVLLAPFGLVPRVALL